MNYSIEKTGNDLMVLKLNKNVTAYQLQKLKDAIQELKDKKETKNVIVDLKDVGYIDAYAIGILTAFSKELRDKGGELKLAQMNDKIKLVFDLSHLSKVYEIFDSMEEARKSFS